jgi:hypothetical protein
MGKGVALIQSVESKGQVEVGLKRFKHPCCLKGSHLDARVDTEGVLVSASVSLHRGHLMTLNRL